MPALGCTKRKTSRIVSQKSTRQNLSAREFKTLNFVHLEKIDEVEKLKQVYPVDSDTTLLRGGCATARPGEQAVSTEQVE